MNRHQKKALYESIMKQVAKTVKKALNEAEYLDNDEELLDEYRDEWDYVMRCIFAELRTDNRHNKSAIGVDDDTLLAYYYEETPIDYEFLVKTIISRLLKWKEDIDMMPHLYPEICKYPNTKYKNVFERCVRVVIQHILEKKELI